MTTSNIIEKQSVGTGVRNMLLAGLRMLLGAPLIISGLVHFSNPYLFLESVLRYDLLPSALAPAFAAMLMCVCLCTGLALVFDWFRHGALVVAVGLFTVFAIGQTIVMLRGLTVLCGCFGTFSHQVTWGSVAGLALLAMLTFLIFYFGPEIPNDANRSSRISDA